MTLPEFWFVLIAFMFVSYFVLEGLISGSAHCCRYWAATTSAARVMINTIAPVWDANETWLVLAAGAMFAAFPHWYGSAFSAFYLPLLAILACLIARGVAFEFRGKVDDPRWRGRWDVCIVTGSIVAPFLWGVFFANLVHGLPLNASGGYVGTLGGLFSPFAVLGGLVVLGMFRPTARSSSRCGPAAASATTHAHSPASSVSSRWCSPRSSSAGRRHRAGTRPAPHWARLWSPH